MGTVAFVGGSKLTVGFRLEFWRWVLVWKKNRIDILEYLSGKAKKPRHAPLFDSSLPTEKRRLEGRRMLTRRPEKDMTR